MSFIYSSSSHLWAASQVPYIIPPARGDRPLVAGDVRCINGSFEVWTGHSWAPVSVSIEATQTFDEVVEWASKKMQEEQAFEQRLEQHPALKNAYDKFKMIDALIGDGSDTST